MTVAQFEFEETATSQSPAYVPSPTADFFISACAEGPSGEMRLLILIGPRGEGKALRNGTGVLTPNGWVKVEDLRWGDEVVSVDGTTTAVIGVYPQPVQPLYRLHFSDGTRAVTTDDHLWMIETSNRRRPGVVTTSEIRRRLDAHAWRGGGRWSIPLLTGPAQLPAQEVPLDPYLLGVLLGDGGLTSRAQVRLTSAEPELLAEVERFLPAGTALRHVAKYDYRIVGNGRVGGNPVLNALTALGLHGLGSHDKRVPNVYLWNHVRVRHAVLQGLLDTDGWVSRHANSVLFSSVSLHLIEAVEFLVRSLGGVTRRQSRVRVGYRLTISLPDHIAPFRLTRKASLLKSKQRRGRPARFIVGYEQVGEGAAICIEVAHPSRLFVIDNFVVTHNTTAGIYACLELAARLAREDRGLALPLRIAVVRDTWVNIQRTTLVSFEENRAKGLPIEFREAGREAIIGFDRPYCHFYFFGLDRPDDADKLQGFACGVLWLEEVAAAAGLATGVPPDVLGLGATSLRQAGVPYLRVLLTLNPPDEDHWVLKVEEELTSRGLTHLLVHRLDIPAGEKSAHFRRLAEESSTGLEGEDWSDAADEFDRYRERNRAFLESIGRHDLVERLVEGKTGGIQVGEPVITTFSDEHVVKEPLPIFRGLPIIRGWDNEPSPAVCFMQPLGEGRGCNVLGSEGLENSTMSDLIDSFVKPFMGQYGLMPPRAGTGFQRGAKGGFQYVDVVDPVLLDSQLSAGQVIMNALGTTLIPGPVAWEDRRAAAIACFNRARRGGRRFMLIEKATNDILVKGLKGRFRYPRQQSTGRVVMTIEAAKRASGVYSQPADALFYGLAWKWPAAEWLRQHQGIPAPPVRRVKSYLGA